MQCNVQARYDIAKLNTVSLSVQYTSWLIEDSHVLRKFRFIVYLR